MKCYAIVKEGDVESQIDFVLSNSVQAHGTRKSSLGVRPEDTAATYHRIQLSYKCNYILITTMRSRFFIIFI